MKKITSFIVNKRYFILAVMLVLAIGFSICITNITITSDMAEYLPNDSGMRQGLDIMDEVFPEIETSNSIRVMFTDLSNSEIENVKSQLATIENVDSVSYDISEDYNKDNYTLFVLNMSCDYGSEEESAITEALNTDFSDYEMCFRNNDTDSVVIPTWVLVLAVLLLAAILFIMCTSWFEPVLFLAVIGIAVVINFGSNIVLGSIGTITASIAAILQLVLSMDYSIMLMNRYRQERQVAESKTDAMKSALEKSFGSISSSSLTTVVGLLMLCFMSFGIGMELGIVLAKGVFISLICVFTILPTLIIACDKLITKTEKKGKRKNAENIAGISDSQNRSLLSEMAAFANKARYIMIGAFLILFVGMCVLQSFTPINFTQNVPDKIADIFPQKNSIVIVYNNDDESTVNKVAKQFAKKDVVKSVTSYDETLGKLYTADELTSVIGDMGSDFNIDSSLTGIIYYDKLDGTVYPIKAGDFFSYLVVLTQNDSLSSLIPDDMQAKTEMLNKFSNKDNLTVQLPSSVLAVSFGMDENQVNGILYATQKQTASISEFINIAATMAQNPGAGIDEATAASLVNAQNIINAVVSDKEYSSMEMSELIGIDVQTTDLLFLMYASNANYNSSWQLSLYDFMNHISEMADNELKSLLSDEMKSELISAKEQLDEGVAQLKSENYSRLIFSTTVPSDGDEMKAFYNELTTALDGTETYLVGYSAMNYEMSKSFGDELTLITILIIVSIFLIVALTFRNLTIPAILVLLVQCAVYITISTFHFAGVYYLALLIVECILMGATIDYAILFTSYYREHRKTMTKQEAIKDAYKGSIHTILTSGLILILVPGAISVLTSGSMGEVCRAVSIGSLSAVTLILLVLPALLIAFDKLVVRKRIS